jgi:hypothetical protein
MARYMIKDTQTGKVYCEGSDYNKMAEIFFHVVDQFYGGDDERSSYLHLVNKETGRSMSVVVGD